MTFLLPTDDNYTLPTGVYEIGNNNGRYKRSGYPEQEGYFFFQILFDVLIKGMLKGQNCPIESDCTPHLLQQSINDPNFNLATKEEILKRTSIHKLTYK